MPVGKQITILANGHNLACALQQFEPTGEAEVQDATVLCNSFKSWEQGFKDGRISATGVWDHNQATLEKIHNVMSEAFENATDLVITSSFEELTVGDVALLMDAFSQRYGINTPLGQLITVSLELQSNNAVNFGHWLMSELVAAGTSNSDSLDNAAATENGGLFHVHVRNDDATDITAVLQHSTNDADWVDLATVSGFAGVRAEGGYTVLANFADEEEISFNGVVFTAMDTPVAPTDFQRGTGATGDDTDLGISIDNLVTMLNASADADISGATYSDNHTSTNRDATEIYVSFDAPGAAGNAYTLDTDTANIERTAATLAGGVDGKAIDARSAVVPKGTTVNRYTRAAVTVAGGDTTLVTAAFARR